MDEFLAVLGVQAMKYAVHSTVALTSKLVLSQCSRLIKSVENRESYSELRVLQKLLDSKIKIISPAIDLVELKGNVFLESAVPLTRSIQEEIASLGRRIELAAVFEECSPIADQQPQPNVPYQPKIIADIIADIKRLLDQIDRDIPLLQLAISASGESLSTSLPESISPSRLLQASTLLIVGDTQYAQDSTRSVQIGPSFTLSVYMLFLGHADATGATSTNGALGRAEKATYGLGEADRKPLWQEVVHKAQVRLCRTATHAFEDDLSGPKCDSEYAYHLEIIEDIDDGRVHDVEDSEARLASGFPGLCESIPIRQLSKIFYTDTGRLLNLGNEAGDDNNPVLLLKRDVNALALSKPADTNLQRLEDAMGSRNIPTVQRIDSDQADIDHQLLNESGLRECRAAKDSRPLGSRGFPPYLDQEWIALEIFEKDVDDSDGSETEDDAILLDISNEERQGHRASRPVNRAPLDATLEAQIRNLALRPDSASPTAQPQRAAASAPGLVARSPFGAITASLSLVEMLLRLAGLQEFQQASHLSIPDHILTFFLEETSTTGLAGEAQWRARGAARRRVGFDPYTDSPAAEEEAKALGADD